MTSFVLRVNKSTGINSISYALLFPTTQRACCFDMLIQVIQIKCDLNAEIQLIKDVKEKSSFFIIMNLLVTLNR